MKIPAGVLILSLVFSNSHIFAESKQPRIRFKVLEKNEYDGEKIDRWKTQELIRGINDERADGFIIKRNRWGVYALNAALLGLGAGGWGIALTMDEKANAGYVLLSGLGLIGLSIMFQSVSLFYKNKAIDRYNTVIGESNKSSSLYFSPGGGQYTIGFRYSF